MNRFRDIETRFKALGPIYGYHSEKLVSIEKALEPVESEIDELPYYIQIAKRYCRYPSQHGLSHDQSAAIYIYSMDWNETSLYCVLNKALRSENRQALKVWFPYMKLFDSALNKLPNTRDTVWRGIPLDIGKNYTKDQIITWWGISSCSSSVNVIKDFIGKEKNSTMFVIETITGKKIVNYTEHENEEEIVLRWGTKFRVKGDPLHQRNCSYLVHLMEIDEDECKF